jgi:hypothetical protein
MQPAWNRGRGSPPKEPNIGIFAYPPKRYIPEILPNFTGLPAKPFLPFLRAFLDEALSTYCMLRRSSGTTVHTPMGSEPLGGGSPCNFGPDLKSLGHDVAVHGGRKPVASWAEMLGDQPIRGEEALRVTRRREPLHAPLPLAGRLMRMLRAIIEIAMLPMFPPRGTHKIRTATIANVLHA